MVHDATLSLILQECSRVEWLGRLNIAQLSHLIVSISYLAEPGLEYVTYLDCILPHLADRLETMSYSSEDY